MAKYKEENTGIHMERIISSVPCSHHSADIGDSCWNLLSARGIIKAICDKRARSAGANGPITPYKKPTASTYKKKDFK